MLRIQRNILLEEFLINFPADIYPDNAADKAGYEGGRNIKFGSQQPSNPAKYRHTNKN